MNSLSTLYKMKQIGTLASMSTIKDEGQKHKKSLAEDLLLTALIDAFSILVIFLLMTFSTSSEVFIGKDMELPRSAAGEILERFPVIRVQENKIYLEDKLLSLDTLVSSLLQLRQNHLRTNAGAEFPGIVTLQADRRLNYDSLNPIVLALSHAGFGEIRFAVIAQ